MSLEDNAFIEFVIKAFIKFIDSAFNWYITFETLVCHFGSKIETEFKFEYLQFDDYAVKTKTDSAFVQ